LAIEEDKLMWMYRTMVRIRTFEKRVQKEFAAGHIPGFAHLYIGEEAVATGTCANLKADDYVTSTHRGHGHVIAKGGKTDLMMAEIYGKKTGYNKGKGGSMHIANVDIGMLGANAIVGAGLTIAGGAALSAKLRGTDQVCVCFFGDGAINTARFHEGLNLASIWKLPVVFICENNLYAESTSISYATNIANIADRAVAYGIPGRTVDGNDVLAVYEASGKAITQARRGDGPTLIVCQTYRWQGHYEGDMQTYKTKEEVEKWVKKDPIPRFRKDLIGKQVLTEKEADKIYLEIEEEIEKAVKFAEESPFPSPEETLEDVYA